MKVDFPPHLQTRLLERAARDGRRLEDTVVDVVARYLEAEDRFVAAVERGEAALQQGGFLTRAQLGDRLGRWLQT